LIDNFKVRLPRMASLIQNLVGFMRSQALVPRMNRQLAQFPELSGEFLGPDGLRTGFSGEAQGISYDDAHDCKPAREPSEGAQIVSRYGRRWAAALERHDRLRAKAQFI
jgi:hypothetical protein